MVWKLETGELLGNGFYMAPGDAVGSLLRFGAVSIRRDLNGARRVSCIGKRQHGRAVAIELGDRAAREVGLR